MTNVKYTCNNCGSEVKPSDTICLSCGKNFSEVGRHIEVTLTESLGFSESLDIKLTKEQMSFLAKVQKIAKKKLKNAGFTMSFSFPQITIVNSTAEKWKSDINKCDKAQFEESRRCLLTAYHTYVQNHAGILIALFIGLTALLSYSDSFSKIQGLLSVCGYKIITYSTLAFWLSLIGICSAIFYDVLRIGYWSLNANEAILMSPDYAYELFNREDVKLKPSYPANRPAPETAILQIAIYNELWLLTKKTEIPRLRRLLVWLQLISS